MCYFNEKIIKLCWFFRLWEGYMIVYLIVFGKFFFGFMVFLRNFFLFLNCSLLYFFLVFSFELFLSKIIVLDEFRMISVILVLFVLLVNCLGVVRDEL